ncbi:hypothetical protein [Botrimarina mediterranea]|uniref:Uncharacterized protein n=1 Tax=Botrimarina mediterranea TaxID=2528022 RepID=A0A518K7U9_9BACT|nr:hypothetical protein [Botrimarina mediterranea]QDV73869.1 hypothetical protein Spa11_20680 [Botrimarina mediterranea]
MSVLNQEPKQGFLLVLFAMPALILSASLADAHIGRRFSVEVVNGKLQAQGVNNGESDGAPLTRPYVNVIHDHWKNTPGLDQAYATLPEYDVSPSAATALLGHSLSLELIGVTRWQSPPMMPGANTAPTLTQLAPGDLITVEAAMGVADSIDFGTVTLMEAVPFGGAREVAVLYQINSHPADEIHVLEFILSTSSAAIEPSNTIYVLLSPDGDNPMAKLHHASLFLEGYLATIPEPTGACLAVASVGGALLSQRRKRRRELSDLNAVVLWNRW